MSDKDDDKGFPEKYAKVIDKLTDFKLAAEASSVEDLKKIIITCEGHLYTIDQEKENDTKLNGAKELVKEYSEPYRDAAKVQTAKIKYALFLMEGQGVDLNPGE